MAIKAGERLPSGTLKTMTKDGPKDITTDDLFKGKKVVLFSVPGAFTPTCDAKHLPGFVQLADQIHAKGVDTIACMAVNDVFVMNAWKKDTGADGKIDFLADGSANFAKAIGLDLDVSARGLGVRSKRYSMLVDNGVVKSLSVEETPGTADVSGADAMLKAL